LDATTLGSVLAAVGVLAGAVVAYLGKRSETALTGYTSLTDDLQEERSALRQEITELHALRTADQAEITRLRIEIAHLRGHP
jgi:cell division protein FtsB